MWFTLSWWELEETFGIKRLKMLFSDLSGKSQGSRSLSSCSHPSWISTPWWQSGDVSNYVLPSVTEKRNQRFSEIPHHVNVCLKCVSASCFRQSCLHGASNDRQQMRDRRVVRLPLPEIDSQVCDDGNEPPVNSHHTESIRFCRWLRKKYFTCS